MSTSKDAKTRQAAQAFSENIDRNINALQREIRGGHLVFEPQRGVLKQKKGADGKPKAPRPIVISPVKNRVVQRAILEICQSNDKKIRKHLGNLPEVIATPTSVGGLPGRGVPNAVKVISEAISDGAKWFVRSDIKKFFQTIPKKNIECFLRSNIRDKKFVDLFMYALATELANEDEVRQQIDLFPLGNTGVPQGSALSALCANIVLSKFDAELNSRAIRTVRYLDDFVILGTNRQAVTKAWGRAQKILSTLGMECHDPCDGGGKAAMGNVSDGFEFLSFHIDSQDCYPSDTARAKLLSDLRDVVRDAKIALQNARNEPRRAQPRFIQSLDLLDRKIRGWGDAFAPTTKRVLLAQLDEKVEEILRSYRDWFNRFCRGRDLKFQRRLMGVALLIDTPHQSEPLSTSAGCGLRAPY